MNNSKTLYLKDEISKCEDIEELKEYIFPLLETQKEQWKKKIQEIISENGYMKTEFAKMCRTSRVTVDKWCKGSIPKTREAFLKIGMVANYGLEEMNQLLQRYGRYPALCSKSLEDCVCIFVIRNNYGKEAIDKYYYILDKIKENLTREKPEPEDISTDAFDEKLSELKEADELDAFIADNSAVFASCYHKFYSRVKMDIATNYKEYELVDPEVYPSKKAVDKEENEEKINVHHLAKMQKWSSSLKQCVYAIQQNNWYPTRNKIISLGLHLSMDLEEINELLELAHMEPLCAKNLFESVIIFILEDASLNDILNAESELYNPEQLWQCAREVLEAVDMPEAAAFISELPEMDDEW